MFLSLRFHLSEISLFCLHFWKMCKVLVTCSCIFLIPWLLSSVCLYLWFSAVWIWHFCIYHFLYLSYLRLAELLEPLCCYSSNTENVQPIKILFFAPFLFPHWHSNYIDIWPLAVSPQVPQAQLSFNMFFLCVFKFT